MAKIWKVMGYNLHAGMDYDWKQMILDKALKVIHGYAPDMLGAEEVLTNNPIKKNINMPQDMADDLKMNVIFGKAMDRDFNPGCEYGVAALSGYPLEFVRKIFLPTPEGKEPRVVLVCRVSAETPVYFLVTHFSYEGEFPNSSKYREDAARLITAEVKKNHWYPAILTGDFNSERDSSIDRIFHEEWDVCNDRDPFTPSVADSIQIDYICTYPKDAFILHDFGFIEDLEGSDHKPVTASLELKTAGK